MPQCCQQNTNKSGISIKQLLITAADKFTDWDSSWIISAACLTCQNSFHSIKYQCQDAVGKIQTSAVLSKQKSTCLTVAKCYQQNGNMSEISIKQLATAAVDKSVINFTNLWNFSEYSEEKLYKLFQQFNAKMFQQNTIKCNLIQNSYTSACLSSLLILQEFSKCHSNLHIMIFL